MIKVMNNLNELSNEMLLSLLETALIQVGWADQAGVPTVLVVAKENASKIKIEILTRMKNPSS